MLLVKENDKGVQEISRSPRVPIYFDCGGGDDGDVYSMGERQNEKVLRWKGDDEQRVTMRWVAF